MGGDIALIIVILARILVPFLILKWPLKGAILAIIADAADVMVIEAFGTGFLGGFSYHHMDKIFDIWYLFFEFIVVMTWTDVFARRIGATLFTWRFAGFLTFMLTAWRPSFFVAPNIFEFFFLACLIIWKFDKKFKFTWKSSAIVLLIVGIPNIIKEYVMHFKFQDQTWDWFRDHVFWWMYN